MTSSLSPSDVRKYEDEGYLAPIAVLDRADVASLREKLETVEADHGGQLPKDLNQKPHLVFTWANDLVRHPRILDAVESIIGPDILCWSTNFFAKDPGDGKRVSWHQDVTYWGFEPTDIVTAWVAFTPSTPASGCMRVVPGSHHQDVAQHVDTYSEDNLLSRGQEIAVDVDEDEAADIVLAPGEMSLHHTKIFHGSEPNRADERRVGFVIRYLSPRVKQSSDVRDSATLVRGRDAHGNFDLEPAPSADFDPEAIAYHAAMLERMNAILFRSAQQ